LLKIVVAWMHVSTQNRMMAQSRSIGKRDGVEEPMLNYMQTS